jgi:RHH-type proline utilization regulon transcriptional repressor/proline dehydrogenase/delta 1-pyrroline-5-carboxylate dehydrogenase
VLDEEIFGPLLALARADDLDHALALANAPAYGLTGGIFSRSPAHVTRATRELRAGNVYVNRGITGARVGRQPFGGIGLSGAGTKAGGPDYLHEFVTARTVAEHTMRHGFVPPAPE